MNTETIYSELNGATSVEQIEALKASVQKEIEELNSKDTAKNADVYKYISENTQTFCTNMFGGNGSESVQSASESLTSSERVNQRAKSLLRFLGLEDKYTNIVWSSWRAYRLKGLNKALKSINNQLKAIEEATKENKEFDYFAMKVEEKQKADELEW